MPGEAESMGGLGHHQLLCERCGYRLHGLDRKSLCPECGKPIVESLPERRTGSAWQRKQSLGSWIATNWRTIRRPRTRWSEVRAQGAYELLACNALGAGALLGACAAYIGYLTIGRIRGDDTLWILMFFVVGAFVVWILSLIEGLGLRLFGRRNGWRTTGEIASAVVAHASIGWLCTPLLFIGVVGAMQMAARLGTNPLEHMPQRPATMLAFVLLVVLPPASGLLAFEVLAWLGWREMRFANHPAPATRTDDEPLQANHPEA